MFFETRDFQLTKYKNNKQDDMFFEAKDEFSITEKSQNLFDRFEQISAQRTILKLRKNENKYRL